MKGLYKIYHRVFFAKILFDGLTDEQKKIVELNTRKHTRTLVLMVLVMVYVYIIIRNFYPENVEIVLNALFGVLFISGTAWFAVSFGAIPSRYLDFAMQITGHLFTAFSVALSSVFIAACITVPLLSPILFLAFSTLYVASVKYDTTDALKIGIDETLYQHARVGRVYFTKQLEKEKESIVKK